MLNLTFSTFQLIPHPPPPPRTLSVTWNRQAETMMEMFRNLHNDDALSDILLVSTKRAIPAHKLVLQACSLYFEVI